MGRGGVMTVKVRVLCDADGCCEEFEQELWIHFDIEDAIDKGWIEFEEQHYCPGCKNKVLDEVEGER